MAVKIIHTADVHLDFTFSGRLGESRGSLKREAIRKTFSRIVDDCISWPADLFVVAGDLFEEERISRTTISFLCGEFARLKSIPVVIAPGNHDPYTPNGRYAMTDWGPNVRIFKLGRRETFSFPSLGVQVHGVAHVSAHMAGRLTEAVTAAGANGGALQVLVAHASNETAVPGDLAADDIWLPFTREEIEGLGYSYAALGHYHAPSQLSSGDRVLAAYPGSPEGLRAGELGRRHYAKVTLDREGACVERVPVSHIDYAELRIACDGIETRDAFLKAVMAADAARTTIARIVATGRVAPGFEVPATLPGEISDRFFFVSLVDETMPVYDWDAIAAERTLRGEVVRRFEARMAKSDEATRALLEKARFYALDAIAGLPVELPAEVTEASNVD